MKLVNTKKDEKSFPKNTINCTKSALKKENKFVLL